MTIPTLTLTLSGLIAEIVWPPTIIEIKENPVTVAALKEKWNPH